jgi:hypothetical protein
MPSVSPSVTPHSLQQKPLLPLPSAFLDPTQRETLYLQVSAALPNLQRRRRLRANKESIFDDDVFHTDDYYQDFWDLEEQEYEQEYEHDQDNDTDWSLSYRQALRFREKVTQVMVEIIEDETNYTVLDHDHRRLNGRRSLRVHSVEPYQPTTQSKLLLVHSRFESNVTLVSQLDTAIWWHYSIAFVTLKQHFTVINSTLTHLISQSVTSGNFFQRLQTHVKKVYAVCLPGEEDTALLVENNSNTTPFDVDEWDARRWIGLGLFTLTLLITLALTRTATHRRKKLLEEQDWGIGLATETDINQLLTYGWEYDGNHQVHAYDKSKLVYRDDDSMLRGVPIRRTAKTEPLTSTERSPSSSSLGVRRADASVTSAAHDESSGVTPLKTTSRDDDDDDDA